MKSAVFSVKGLWLVLWKCQGWFCERVHFWTDLCFLFSFWLLRLPSELIWNTFINPLCYYYRYRMKQQRSYVTAFIQKHIKDDWRIKVGELKRETQWTRWPCAAHTLFYFINCERDVEIYIFRCLMTVLHIHWRRLCKAYYTCYELADHDSIYMNKNDDKQCTTVGKCILTHKMKF